MFTAGPHELVSVKGTEKTAVWERLEGDSGSRILTIGMVAPLFLEWSRFEMRRALWTVQRYREALAWVVRDIGDQPVAGLHLGHLLELRRRMEERGCGPARVAAVLNSLRCLLRFCRDVLRTPALDPRQVRMPRHPKRDVVFLTKEEVARFLDATLLLGKTAAKDSLTHLRLRAIAEVLLGTGARISEILQLRRDDVNFEKREARTIGKGNKERVLFFTERSLVWLRRYLDRRSDDHDALFVCQGDPPRRLRYESVKGMFRRAGRRAGITKHVTPHILRHTMATTLLFNGCPIGHIKELLGHERLDTTCRYYLGLDKRAAKQAHEKFLTYDEES
jgi:site-specific recombinase XerD